MTTRKMSQESRDLLLDQRLNHINEKLTNIEILQKTSSGVLPVVQFDIQRLQEKVKVLEINCIPKERFERLENIIIGGIKLILTAFVVGLIALVYRTNT